MPKPVATYRGKAQAINRTDNNRVVKSKDIQGERELKPTKFMIGDGNASVSVTRGFKTWFSTRDAGMTVESTVTVTVKCAQDQDAITCATQQAGHLAEEMAARGNEEMGLHLDKFADELNHG